MNIFLHVRKPCIDQNVYYLEEKYQENFLILCALPYFIFDIQILLLFVIPLAPVLKFRGKKNDQKKLQKKKRNREN